MTNAIAVVQAYQDECGWNDNTSLVLLTRFIDKEHLADKLAAFLSEIAKEESDDMMESD